MPTVELDQDVFEYLAEVTLLRGVTASTYLRTELPIAAPRRKNGGEASLDRDRRLIEFATSTEVTHRWTALEKYFALLSFIIDENESDSDRLLTVAGTNRKYFAKTSSEIANSGNSTAPQRIPETKYWALTNSDNRKKQSILRQVAHRFGYSRSAVDAVAHAIKSGAA